MKTAALEIASLRCVCKTLLVTRFDERIPIPDDSVDVIVSFYSLEHVQEIDRYISDLYKILRPGGYLVGAVPAESGLVWGLERLITSRRWLKRNFDINFGKIICWEHPNFRNEVIEALDKQFTRVKVRVWPFRWRPYDLNLLVSLNFKNRLELLNWARGQ